MSTKADYFSLDGVVMLAKVSSVGQVIGEWLHMGDMPTFSYEITVENNDIKESMSSKRQVFLSIPTSTDASIAFSMRNLQPETMAIMNRGKITKSAGGTIPSESIAAASDGGYFPLARQLVTNLVITDSDGTPATLEDGVNYTYDPVIGLINWIDVEEFTLPLKAAYTYGASTTVSILTLPPGYYAMRFLGKNKAPDGKRMAAEFYKIQLDPKGLDFIVDEVNAVEGSGKILADLNKPEDEEIGQYGYLRTY